MLLDGKKLKEEILKELKIKISKENLDIALGIIQVGDDPASNIYINKKMEACELIGIKSILKKLDSNVKEEDIIDVIENLNNDPSITGIILQSPITKGLDYDKCCEKILPEKDVDGFTKENIYKLYLGHDTILPCTVKGIIKLLEYYDIPITGANVVIVGRGNIVGKPLGLALLNKDATVLWTHSKTKDLKSITKMADILIVAAGAPHLIKEDMIKDGAVVIDVGVSKIDGHIVGDVDFDNVSKKASYITPNPGGVGPMTVAMIMDNLVNMKR